MKRLCITASLACVAIISGAAEFFGLQTTPAWNDRGDLTVEVSNWSKLSIRVEGLTAMLAGGGGEPCEWKMADAAFELGPTGTHTVVVATRRTLEACASARELFAGREARAVRFVPVASGGAGEADRFEAPLVTLQARLTLRDRPLEASSRWSLDHGRR